MTIKELCKKHINCSVCPYLPICGDRPENYGLGEDLEVTNAIIETAKALEQDVQPIRPEGHWIRVRGMNEQCSECKRFFPLSAFVNRPFSINYCPSCGAKMVEPQESEVES